MLRDVDVTTILRISVGVERLLEGSVDLYYEQDVANTIAGEWQKRELRPVRGLDQGLTCR